MWLIINGKVYDVTEYHVYEHPGGPDPLLKRGGKDATGAFNSIHNHAADSSLPEFMKTLCIGEVVVEVDK